MKEIADYLISSVLFATSPHKHISDVLLHTISEKKDDGSYLFSKGEKTDKDVIVRLINDKTIVKTVIWNYTKPGWVTGAVVGVEKIASGNYLRTHKDKSIADNIDNLMTMGAFI